MIDINQLLAFCVALAATSLTSACSHMSDNQTSETWVYQPEANKIGRIYYYERSNIDGSMDERITVFHRTETELEVYKENGLCSNAALVTAEIDPETFSATRITGGQLQPDAEHFEFAFLNWDRDSNELLMEVKLPQMTIEDSAAINETPWHLFDFDLASLTVMTPHLANANASFDFGMALLWAEPTNPDPLFWMGHVTASPQGEARHLGHETRKYALSGTALESDRATGSSGTLWLDAQDGYIVDAVFPTPNHPGYTDFRLRLDHVSDGGEKEWDALLRVHFENCEN